MSTTDRYDRTGPCARPQSARRGAPLFPQAHKPHTSMLRSPAPPVLANPQSPSTSDSQLLHHPLSRLLVVPKHGKSPTDPPAHSSPRPRRSPTGQTPRQPPSDPQPCPDPLPPPRRPCPPRRTRTSGDRKSVVWGK